MTTADKDSRNAAAAPSFSTSLLPKFLPGPLVGLMDDGDGGKRQKICFPAVSTAPDLIDCQLYFDGSLSDMMGLTRLGAASTQHVRFTETRERGRYRCSWNQI